jgi:hypothetical protein
VKLHTCISCTILVSRSRPVDTCLHVCPTWAHARRTVAILLGVPCSCNILPSKQPAAALACCMQVLDLSGGTMRLSASMAIPSLQDAAATSAQPAALPVLQLWYDGHRAAVGNSRHQAVWIVELTGAQASVELSGK